MPSPDAHGITSLAALRERMGEPNPATPKKKGNKLLFGLQNLLANPRVGLIFVVPGTDETLRVGGRAELRTDPELPERLSARGQPALLEIRVRIERCFFHCARAPRRGLAGAAAPAGHRPAGRCRAADGALRSTPRVRRLRAGASRGSRR